MILKIKQSPFLNTLQEIEKNNKNPLRMKEFSQKLSKEISSDYIENEGKLVNQNKLNLTRTIKLIAGQRTDQDYTQQIIIQSKKN
jgi:hypothetical protein